MEVIMVVPSWGKECGVAEYSRNLVAALAGLGCPVRVIRGPGELPGIMVPGRLVHFQFEYALYPVAELRNFVNLCRARGTRVIATLHDFSPAAVEANAFVRSAFDAYVALAPQVESVYISIGIPRGRISVIPMGCFGGIPGRREETKHLLGMGPGPNIGFFGFALPQKGILELIAAVKLLRSSGYPDLGCLLLASRPFFSQGFPERVAAFIAEEGLAGVVRQVNDYLPISQVIDFLHAMDINVLPYRDPGYIGASSAVRVALSARRPLVVSDISYFADLRDEVYKVSDVNPEFLDQAIRRVILDVELRNRMAAAQDAYIRRNTWEAAASAHFRLYRQLAGEAGVIQVGQTQGQRHVYRKG